MPRKSKQTVKEEMKISLATLVEIGACSEARRAFISEFGDGSPTSKEVFHAIAKGKRDDWLFWLTANLKGFIEAVGNEDDGEFHCRVDGEFSLNTGIMISSGSATVRASGSATVRAYDSATVRASGSATVRAYDSATVEAYDSATVLLNSYSLGVSFCIKSEMACVVDRRNGRPQLILVETTEEEGI